MPRTRPPYPAEFREQALRLMRAGHSPRELSADLGVSQQTLTNWRRQDHHDGGTEPVLAIDERARLRELERENRLLREERDILRKPPPSSPRRR